MKFKKSTILLLASALVLGTGVFIYEVTISPQMEAAKLNNKKVFEFEMEQVESLTLETPERKLEFSKVGSKSKSAEPQWQMKILEASDKSELNNRKPVAANEAYVSFLLSLLANAQSDRQIPLNSERKTEYGLERPQATIDFTLKNDTSYQLTLGQRDFSDNFLYAIATLPDDPQSELSAILVPTNFENGVNRPLVEWKAESETSDTTKGKESESQSKPDNNSEEVTTPQETPSSQPTSEASSEEQSIDNPESSSERSTSSPAEEKSDSPETKPTENPDYTPSPKPENVEKNSDSAPSKKEGEKVPENSSADSEEKGNE